MQPALSETTLMKTSRQCYSCGIHAVHEYHMIIDHTHTATPANPLDFVTVELDAPCDFCISLGGANCCGCFIREETGSNYQQTGLFLSICEDCRNKQTLKMGKHGTYTFCMFCITHTECPICRYTNDKQKNDIYRDPEYIVSCKRCYKLYTPRNTELF